MLVEMGLDGHTPVISFAVLRRNRAKREVLPEMARNDPILWGQGNSEAFRERAHRTTPRSSEHHSEHMLYFWNATC